MTVELLDPTELVERAAYELEGAGAMDVLRWAGETFGSRLAIASSMQDGVLTHLAGRVVPSTDVLFLDTGYHFVETLVMRDAVAATYPGRVLSITPVQSVAEQDEAYGPRLHERAPDLCCLLRKRAPLDDALRPYDAWVTGLRHAESPDRRDVPVVAYDAARGKVRIAPLARWRDSDVADYVRRHDVLVNPLVSKGFPSIGCAPCTRAVRPGEDSRAGRWAGLSKTECGIH